MRIKEFSIQRYGPLTESGVVRLGNFNLFYGKNEDGKTLTLEALIRLLLGNHRKIFPGIERVAQQPEGFLVLENGRGDRYTLPESGHLTDLINLSPEEYRNLFIIRNSDLSIIRETQFYDDVTIRLTGMRTHQIQQLKDRLREVGHFTNRLDTSNTRDNQYLKRRLQDAHILVEESETFFQEAKESGYDLLEEELVRLQQRLLAVEETISTFGKARLREKYETGCQHLELSSSLLEQLEKYAAFTEEELIRWRQAELFIEEKELEKKLTFQQYKAQLKEIEEAEEALTNYRNHLHISQKRYGNIEETLKPLLRKYGDFNSEYARLSASKSFFRYLFVIFVVASLLALLGVIINPVPGMLRWAAGAGTLTFLFALIYFFRFIKPRGELKRLEQQAMNQASDLGLPGDNIAQVQEQIQRFVENLERQRQRITETEARIAYLQNSSQALKEDRISELEKRTEEARQTIREIQTTQKVESLDNYREKLQEKRKCEQSLQESLAVLKSLFDGRRGSYLQCLQQWQKEVDALSEYKHAAPGVQYNDKTLEKKRAEREMLRGDIEKIQRNMRDFRNRLADLERRTYEAILPEEELFPSRTLADLCQLQQRLENFIKGVERKQELVREAIAIFDELEEEERQKVSSLFGQDSNISHFYQHFTEGLYPAVHYESPQAGIRIQRQDGKLLDPLCLSSGAYDQLYFAIRLALGEKLFQKDKVFFILDDPFLKSDRDRLHQQLNFLIDLSREGWQILYFTAKDEVKAALHPYIEQQLVTLQTVPRVDFKE